MAVRVFGVGLGVFLIAFIWFAALVLSLVFHRIRTVFTLVFTGTAAVLTAILLAIPLDYRNVSPQTESLTSETPLITDSWFIVRVSLLVLVATSAVLGGMALFYLNVSQPRETVPFLSGQKQPAIEELH